MKPKYVITVGLLVLAQTACTQTNFFPLLQCGDRTYTNATIGSITPAAVTVSWDGGGAQIAITNLPEELQVRYHYDPQTAQHFLDAEAAKKAVLKAKENAGIAFIAAVKSMLGPAQLIRIVKVISGAEVQIVQDGQYTDAYINKVPHEVLAFVEDYNKTKDFVERTIHADTSASLDFHGQEFA